MSIRPIYLVSFVLGVITAACGSPASENRTFDALGQVTSSCPNDGNASPNGSERSDGGQGTSNAAAGDSGASPSTVYDPLTNIRWTDVQNYGGVEDIGSAHYVDVIGHTAEVSANYPGCTRAEGLAFPQASGRVHETEHMLHCQIRRVVAGNDNTQEAVYYGLGKAVVFKIPQAKVTDLAARIPSELRDVYSPYKLYILENPTKTEFNNTIGALFNEWASYCSGMRVLLELEKAGKPEPDGASGHQMNHAPYFFGYLAIGMHHLRTAEPSALQDAQFKAVFALYSEYTWSLMRETLASKQFSGPWSGKTVREHMDYFRSPAFAEVRSSLNELYGQAWVDKLMQP